MKIILVGHSGKMGKEIEHIASDLIVRRVNSQNSRVFFENGVKMGDVIIDFSTPQITNELCDYAIKTAIPMVIGTTGQTKDNLKYIENASKKIPIFLSANMSIVIGEICIFLKRIARIYPSAQFDILETHHTQKKDCPSGTSLILAGAIKQERGGEINTQFPANYKRDADDINLYSLRQGEIQGTHKVIITLEDEQIVIEHKAFNRKLFAQGALTAAEFLLTKENGLYSLSDIVRC